MFNMIDSCPFYLPTIVEDMGGGASTSGGKSSPFFVDIQDEHGTSVNCMTTNPDGTLMVTGGDDGSVRLWSTGASCSPLNVLNGHTKFITCVQVFENIVLSGSADGTVRRWNLSNGECTFVYEGHRGMVNRVICTGDLVISSSYDCTARVWMNEIGASEQRNPSDACLRILRGHLKGVYPLAFVPVELEENLPIGEEVQISEDLIITASADGTARSWSIEKGECVFAFIGHVGPVQALAVNDNGRLLFTGGQDKTVRVWRTNRGECLQTLAHHGDGIVNMLVWNNTLFTGSADRTARSWMLSENSCEPSRVFKGHDQSVTAIHVHDGILYTGSGEGTVRGYEVKTGILLRYFKGHSELVNCIRASHKRLYTGSYDGTLRVWTVDEIKESDNPNRFPRHMPDESDLLQHPDDQIREPDYGVEELTAGA